MTAEGAAGQGLGLLLGNVTGAAELSADFVLYFGVNLVGMYTRYLTDLGQRRAFLETHRSLETRLHTEKENERQEKLLLSGKLIPRSLVFISSPTGSISVC